MKKHLILPVLLLLASPWVMQGQGSFEGIITFKMNLEGDNAETMKAMMPSAYTYFIKGNSFKFTMEGGMVADMMGDILIDGESGNIYMLQPSTQTAYKIDKDEGNVEELKPNIEKLKEKTSIQGYTCQKYKVSMETPQGSVTQYIWATKDLKIKLPEMGGIPGGGPTGIKGMDGFPLKVQMELPMGMGEMIMEASEISKQKLQKKEFKLPKDYEVKDFDPSAMMGG